MQVLAAGILQDWMIKLAVNSSRSTTKEPTRHIQKKGLVCHTIRRVQKKNPLYILYFGKVFWVYAISGIPIST